MIIQQIRNATLKRGSLIVYGARDGGGKRDNYEAISFDPYTHGYYKVSGRVGEAFKDGLKL